MSKLDYVQNANGVEVLTQAERKDVTLRNNVAAMIQRGRLVDPKEKEGDEQFWHAWLNRSREWFRSTYPTFEPAPA